MPNYMLYPLLLGPGYYLLLINNLYLRTYRAYDLCPTECFKCYASELIREKCSNVPDITKFSRLREWNPL